MADHEHHHHDHGHADGETYEGRVVGYRAAKNSFFGSSASSPIPEEERESFKGLPYYPIAIAYRFDGLRLQPYAGDEPSAFQIPTSDGKLRPAHRAGTLVFDIGGEPRRLTGYVLDAGDPESLFVPFLDATSGTETYGAGRYLDLEPEDDGSYVLDFNLAYHPSCVYDARFSCPLTPPENRLPIRIEAGERLAETSEGH
jgi:uncharacterized protein (DUF1684 family)